MQQKPPLTFLEFALNENGIPRYDNFIIFFQNGVFGEQRRQLLPYKKLQQEAPNLERTLRFIFSRIKMTDYGSVMPFNRRLYRAYIIMRGYVNSDKELAITH